MKRLLAAIAVTGAMVMPAGSHPHVFVGGGAHFGLNADGQLERLHISWIYDTYASLYLLSYVDADSDGDQVLTEDEKARVIADQTEWPDEFAGDSYLSVEGRKLALSRPVNPDTRILEDGRVEVTFDRVLETPFRPGQGEAAASVRLYDPTFYYAYEVSQEPEIRGPATGCQSELNPFDETATALVQLREELSSLGTDETPTQQDVGALFSDELVLTCD